MPPVVPVSSGTSNVTQVAQNQLNQIVGKLADTSSSQSGDLVTAINALAAAINAKPSA